MECFVCHNTCDSTENYFAHLNTHVFSSNVEYQCTYTGCFQKFIRKYAFKRHVTMHFLSGSKKTCLKINEKIDDSGFPELCVSASNQICTENQTNNSHIDPKTSDYKRNLTEMYDSASKFITKLHSIANFSRSDVNSIRKLVEELILIPVINVIEMCQIPSNCAEKTFSSLLLDVKNIFEHVKTDYMFEKTLKDKDLIGTIETFSVNNDPKSSGVLMPLEFQFKKLFEKNDYLDDVLKHMKHIEESKKYENFIQGKLWKQKKILYPGKTLIPYFLYGDDFGINNPLGSKSNRHSMCHFYYSFPCIPEKSSKLSNVFLAYSIKSSDIKNHGNNSLEHFVNALKKLEISGVNIKTKNGYKNIKFVMGLLLGDNLGLNVTLGFSKSFSANYYCRFCLSKKSECQKEFNENKCILRNRINYKESIDRGTMREIGISSICIFNNIPSFHCTENFSVDIMHDVFEGICHHVLSNSILYFLKTMKFFTFEVLNKRLKTFRYDQHDKGNEKLSISIQELENHKLKMSAKQMLSFCQYFTVLIGEYIPNGDSVWLFILKFFELIEDMLCYQVTDALIEQIRSKIEYLNRRYQILFKCHLTPKFHFLLHYTTVIKQSGPLRNLWCFKYEGKHKEFKIYSHVITSRKNIAKSFSFKQQTAFANFLLEDEKLKDISFKSELLDLDVKRKISNKINISVDDFSIFLEANIWGYNYDSKKIIAKFTTDFELFQIKFIITTICKQIILCCNKIFAEFNTHYSAFEFRKISKQYSYINIIDIVGPPINQIKTSHGKEFIKLKEFYKNIYQ